MALISKISDGSGTKTLARVTTRGQLVVGPADFSEASTVTLGTDNVPVNLFGPISGKNFIITDILIYANRLVGVNDATVTIYESSVGPASTTQTKVLLSTEMVKQSSRDLIGLNLEVAEGRWVNAVTDDDDVFVTVMGYYIKVNGV